MYEKHEDKTNFDDVGDFHEKFGLDNVTHHDFGYRDVPDDVILFRLKFMLEELMEYADAMGFQPIWGPTGLEFVRDRMKGRNHELAFDSLLDLAYVVFGTAHFQGYPWQLGWRLVQRANMAKKRAENAGESKRGHALDVVKPEGWTPPNIRRLLEQMYWTVQEKAPGFPKKEYGHSREGNDCAPEFCGGTRYDPCVYTPEEIAQIERLEAMVQDTGNRVNLEITDPKDTK